MSQKTKDIIKWSCVAIITAAAILFAQKGCKSGENGGIERYTDTLYIRNTDTVFIESVLIPPSKVDTFVLFNEAHDTLYLSFTAYDTIRLDSLEMSLSKETVVIHDSIVNHIKDEDVFGMFLGVSAMPSINGKFDIGVDINAVIDEKNAVKLGYNFVNRQIVIGYSRKLFSIKKKNK